MKMLSSSWEKNWITNRGPLVLDLEKKLIQYLNVPFLTLTTNGTLPIQMAIKSMELRGEIITTPFSYIASMSPILWEGCTPIFVDIDSEYLTINELEIESAITDRTSAILATHVFGNPCNVKVIERIAQKHGLKVIYDAAHSFGVQYNGKSIFNYGDVSTCSFHATKLFHTGEGGCMITKDDALHDKLFYHHNFGHNGPEEFFGLGVNAKMSELQAALGISMLNHLDFILKERKSLVEKYNVLLEGVPVQRFSLRPGAEWNYHYYPVIFPSEEILLNVRKEMNGKDIFPRRYFYPSLNLIPFAKGGKMEVAESISKRVMCMPLYVGLEDQYIEQICSIIKSYVQ